MTELFLQDLRNRGDAGEARRWTIADRRGRLKSLRIELPDATLAELAQKTGASVATVQSDLRVLGKNDPEMVTRRRPRTRSAVKPARVVDNRDGLPDELREPGAGWSVVPGAEELRSSQNFRVPMRRAALAELQRRYRATQKELATSLGVSVPTLAADLRAMHEEREVRK
jgi:DNA-binding XRE family transcriptional regulator